MASNYEELIEALRSASAVSMAREKLMLDAADAIERITAMYEKAEMDATNLTGKLAQAEADIERMKEVIDELREAQTYIDHYGDRWMTSAKDVPTAAYEHGYADGRDEAESQLPKRGEMKNADKIRAMTDEELAKWVTSYGRYFGEEYEGYMSCLDWLKEEVQDDKTGV